MLKKYLLIVVIFILSGGSLMAAETEKMNPGQSKKLSDEGWAIVELEPPPFSFMDDDFSNPWYESHCDKYDVTRHLFERAIELDQNNADAWRGLGHSLEQIGTCFGGSPITWFQSQGFDPRFDKIRIKLSSQEPETLVKAKVKAGAMYEKACLLAAGDHRNWQAWGINLLGQAYGDEKKRHELIQSAGNKFRKAIDLKPDDDDIWFSWGAYLMALVNVEQNHEIWAGLMDEATGYFSNATKRPPDLSGGGESGESSKNYAGAKKALGGMLLYLSFTNDLSHDKILSLRMEACKYFDDENMEEIYDFIESGLCDLALAEIIDDEKTWKGHLTSAEKKYDQALEMNKKSHNGLLPNPVRENWMDITRRVQNDEKRAAFTMAVARANEKWGNEAGMIFGLYNTSRKIGEESPDDNYIKLLYIYAFLPTGAEKDKLLAGAEKELEKIVAQAAKDEQAEILKEWAGALLTVAAMEPAQEKYRAILEKAYAKYSLANEGDDKTATLISRSFALISAVKATDDQERKWEFLTALAELTKDIETYEPSRHSKKALANVYIQLAELRKDSRNEYLNKAWRKLLEAAEFNNEEDFSFSSYSFGDMYFTAAQVLSSLHRDGRNKHTNWDFSRQNLARAIALYRKEFGLYPALSENQNSIGKPSAWTTYWTEAAGKTPETFQYHITKKLALRVLEIYQACDPDTMDAWSLTQLASLHRHLASSGMVTSEYQELYWRRAEEMLRRAIDMGKTTDLAFQKNKPNPPKKINLVDDMLIYETQSGDGSSPSFTQEEYKLYDPSLAMSELGLLLSEKTLKGDEQKEARLKEAEDLWKRAEELRPGSSRYAIARWAAWRGDLEELKKNLRHNRNDLRAMLFPDFEEAAADPAFAAYVGEAWFKKCWYGFDWQGSE